jgi:hypothetical protein
MNTSSFDNIERVVIIKKLPEGVISAQSLLGNPY